MARRRLAPTSLLALLTLALVALAPRAGIRVHRHADHGPAHVHLEDLLGGGSRSELDAPSVPPGGRLRELAGRAAERPLDLVLRGGGPWSPTDLHRHGGTRLGASALEEAISSSRPGGATLHRSRVAAHAHASSPFLRTIPAALTCWIVSRFVLAAASDPPLSYPRPQGARPRARSPPLASRSLRAI